MQEKYETPEIIEVMKWEVDDIVTSSLVVDDFGDTTL